jgi:hypothetical protein
MLELAPINYLFFLLPSPPYTDLRNAVFSLCHAIVSLFDLQGCIPKFSDWPPGVRTANGTALCH